MNEKNTKALINGKIVTMAAKGVIENGSILIKHGKIAKVGRDIPLPPDVETINVEGKIVTPGLIDAHTHLGVIPLKTGRTSEPKANESTDPVTPELRVIDGINHEDPGFESALSGGVTTAMVLPGSSSGPWENLNVIAGQGSVVKCSEGIVETMVLKQNAGLKIGLGDRPQETFNNNGSKKPATRMGVASLLRTNLVKAQEYQRKMEDAKKDSSKEKPERDLAMEALVSLLAGEYPARMHAYRADDIYTAVRIGKEFELDVVIDHGVEAHQVAEVLADHDIPVVFGPIMHGRSMFELGKLDAKTPSILTEKGVKVAITSDHPGRPIKYLTYHAALAAREGLGWIEALKTITRYPAEILGIENKVGTLEEGKDADIAVFNGDPLDPLTQVEKVFLNGTHVFSQNS